MARPNAALYYAPEGYSTAGDRIMGINVASEGMLRGMALHAGVDRLYALCEAREAGAIFEQTVSRLVPSLAAGWISTAEMEKLAPVGALMLPGPGLAAYGWMRRRVGSAAFSLCGVTHTTATPLALDALTDLLVAPVEPWDALVCTSRAVRSMVSRILEEQLIYLEERFGRIARARPQLPIIPLGVDTAAFTFTEAERAAAREALGVAPGTVALLFAGRLTPTTKAHPTPLFLAAAMAAARAASPLHLVFSGWFDSPGLEAAYGEAAAMICPTVRFSILDGRPLDQRRRAWAGADILVSPVDNVQETFGLTPLEAMAAGLPVIASDWDGYRDTVRHGVDGLLIRSWTPPGGRGGLLALRYGARTLGYDGYAGAASQATALDIPDLAEAIVALADDPDRRREMGASGRRRANTEFDWARIIPQYQDLWLDLAGRRKQAPPARTRAVAHPARPDPFWAFAGYPTAVVQADTPVRLGQTAPEMIEVLLASPLIAFAAGTLPDGQALETLLDRAEGGPTTVANLLGAGADAEVLWRGLVWLAKYGLLRLGT